MFRESVHTRCTSSAGEPFNCSPAQAAVINFSGRASIASQKVACFPKVVPLPKLKLLLEFRPFFTVELVVVKSRWDVFRPAAARLVPLVWPLPVRLRAYW